MDTNVTRRTRAEKQRADLNLFRQVQHAYAQLIALPPIAAMQVDHDSPRPKILAGTAIDFKIDIEKATETACRTPDQQRAWFDLLEGRPVEPELEARVIQASAHLYRARSLRRDRYVTTGRRLL